jgi:hypothetical protein
LLVPFGPDAFLLMLCANPIDPPFEAVLTSLPDLQATVLAKAAVL